MGTMRPPLVVCLNKLHSPAPPLTAGGGIQVSHQDRPAGGQSTLDRPGQVHSPQGSASDLLWLRRRMPQALTSVCQLPECCGHCKR